MATINDLPVELQLQIQHSVSTPKDLRALIQAHRHSLYVFNSNRKQVLTSVLKSAIPGGALRDALFACYAPPPTPYSPISPPEVLKRPLASSTDDSDIRTLTQVWLDRYFGGGDAPSFPDDTPSLSRLARLASLVDRFTKDYTSDVARRLKHRSDNEEDDDGGPPLDLTPLSAAEKTRIHRAFYRYEFYCRMFRCYPGGRHRVLPEDSSLFDAREQYDFFIRRMNPWEVEEISCIYDYFSSRAGDCVQDLEDQAVAAVLSASGATTKPEPIPTVPSDVDHNLPLFQPPESHGMKMADFSSKLASYGLAYMDRLLYAGGTPRCDIIRSEEPFGRHFLTQALGIDRRRRPVGTIIPGHWSVEEILSSIAALGHRVFIPVESYMRRGRWIRMADEGEEHSYLLRQRGYVFWDQKRCSDPVIDLAFRNSVAAPTAGFRAKVWGRGSIEERVKGVNLPPGEKERILEGFRFCSWYADDWGKSDILRTFAHRPQFDSVWLDFIQE